MKFYKYQGTGNDFVMIDNRSLTFDKSNVAVIENLCNRRFGIGGDGLILLENHAAYDFEMVYFNSDGKQSSMCGNGGRCIVAFAKKLQIIEQATAFIAIDGVHHANVADNGEVSLQMIDIETISFTENHVFLNSGSPHHIEMVDDLKNIDVQKNGSEIRYSKRYEPDGSNVNFVSKINDNTFAIRTYERGVEAETLSCGTGATAAAIAVHAWKSTEATSINIMVQGGQLRIDFDVIDNCYKNIYLTGKALFVFEGDFLI